MNRFKKDIPEDILISWAKIFYIVKKYWLVCVALTFVGFIVSLVMAIAGESREGEASDLSYSASTTLYVDCEYNNAIARSAEAVIPYSTFYENFINEYIALIRTDKIRDRLNDRLVSSGFDELITEDDGYSIYIFNQSRIFNVDAYSKDEAKVTFMSSTLAELLIDAEKEVFGRDYLKYINKTRSAIYLKSHGSTVSITPEERDELVATAEGTDNIFLQKMGSLKSIAVIGVGFILGMAILFLFVLLDKRIYSSNELWHYIDCGILGVFDSEKKLGQKENYDMIALKIGRICETEMAKRILITSASKDYRFSELSSHICNFMNQNNINVKCCASEQADIALMAESIDDKEQNELTLLPCECFNMNANAVRLTEASDLIFFVIFRSKDTEMEIHNAFQSINLLNGKIVGCILL